METEGPSLSLGYTNVALPFIFLGVGVQVGILVNIIESFAQRSPKTTRNASICIFSLVIVIVLDVFVLLKTL